MGGNLPLAEDQIETVFEALLRRPVGDDGYKQQLLAAGCTLRRLLEDVRNSAELKNHIREEILREGIGAPSFNDFAATLYRNEATLRASDENLSAYLRQDGQTNAQIARAITAVSCWYVDFHARRFHEQLQAVVHASAWKKMGRLLDFGLTELTGAYRMIRPEIEVFSADHISVPVLEEICAVAKFFQVDLERESLHEKFPELVANPMDIIVFAEVIEHIRAEPEVVLADLLKILAPGGMIYLSTPNALSINRVQSLYDMKKPDVIYKKSDHKPPYIGHNHVREYTPLELREAVTAAGGKVLYEEIRDYYQPPDSPDGYRSRYVSARDCSVLIIGH